MYCVAIIGAGNLGSRHLQALALSRIPLTIEVVDSSKDSLRIAEQRWQEMPHNPLIRRISFFHDISGLSSNLDVVIIATSSAPRRKIVEKLLQSRHIQYLLLEKVLFQQIDAYETIQRMLDKYNVKAWVNCGRRNTNFYRYLQKKVKNDSWIDMKVFGSQWGLGCNSIHMIDIYSFLSAQEDFVGDIELLDPGWVNSKREGYIEFTGTLRLKSHKGTVVMTSVQKGNQPIIITMQSDSLFCVIQESAKMARIFQNDGKTWKWENIPVDLRNQSEITQEIVQTLIESGNCGLTPYAESAMLHKVLIKAFLEHINLFNKRKTDVCAIT